MNEKVREYLRAKRAEEVSRSLEKESNDEREQALYRRRVMIKAGLFYKEYTDINYKTDAYPNYDAQVGKYFAAVTYPVSDEEFEEIARYTKLDDEPKNKTVASESLPCKKSLKSVLHNNELAVRINNWAGTLETIGTVIAWIIVIIGFFAALSTGEDANKIAGVFTDDSEGVAVLVVLAQMVIYGIAAFLINLFCKFGAMMLYAQAAIVQNTKIAADAATYALWKEENKDPTEK